MISDEDVQAVLDVLRSDFLTQGPAGPLFESAISDYCGSQHAVAVSSATAALHLACLALGVSQGDVVWTSPITFVASANCALYCGADVDFVDIDPFTYNMSVAQLESKLVTAKQVGRLPKVVIPVHLCGQSCDMRRIHELSLEYGFSIIEDASHAIGGRYLEEPVGNCRFSDITVFSFHPVKIVTTAEGGVATTNSTKLANKISLLRSHGVTRDSSLMTHEADGDWYYQQIALGFNYRLTDIQAALGTSQMKKIDEFVAKRHELVKAYNKLLSNLPITLPWQNPDTYSSFHLYVIRLHLGEVKTTHREIFDALRKAGIGVNLHYIPVHRQPYYEAILCRGKNSYPEAERYYSEAISLPLHPSMTDEDLTRVVRGLRDVLV